MTIYLENTENINANNHVNESILEYAQMFMDMFLRFKNDVEI